MMRRPVVLLSVILAGMAVSGCESVGYDEGPVEYASRPVYRDVYRQPSPPVYDRYDRYSRYDDIYDRPPPQPRYYRPYGGPRPYYDRYDRY